MTGISEPVPGIRLIRLPLPFELEHVNVGLVELDNGFMLIDTGMTFDALEVAVCQLSVRWSDIRSILATHIHPDHISCAPRIVSASGASLLMHRAEFEFLNGILTGEAGWIDAAFTQGGVPRDAWDTIRESVGGMRSLLSQVHPDRFLQGGEVLPTALGPATVIPTPGHSVGHVCLYWPDRKLLYSGDHMIEKITPNIAWMPGRDMLGEYLESLDRVAALDVDLVMASHGDPFRNHRDWILATQRHHEERCSGLLDLIAAKPRTAYELVPALWGRDFSSFHLYFALFEVLAHLEHLRRRGKVSFDEHGLWRQMESGRVVPAPAI